MNTCTGRGTAVYSRKSSNYSAFMLSARAVQLFGKLCRHNRLTPSDDGDGDRGDDGDAAKEESSVSDMEVVRGAGDQFNQSESSSSLSASDTSKAILIKEISKLGNARRKLFRTIIYI